jgi:phosphoglucomutase
MNPNHYLAAAISYLYENHPDWSSSCTVVNSGIVDRVAAKLGRKLAEVLVLV